MMGITGHESIDPVNGKINKVTGTKQGNKRALDVFLIGQSDREGTGATHDPQYSAGLAAGANQFYVYPAVPTDTKTLIIGGVFCSSVFWKVELIVNGVSRYTFMGDPGQTVPYKFDGFTLTAGQQLQIRFTNRSSNAVQVGSVYSTLEFSNKAA